MIVPPKTYFAKIQAVLKKYDILFIVDEVICGFGRTGNMFGSETYNLQPDIMTMAKALSSAYLPISAVLINEKIFAAISENSDKIGTFRARLYLFWASCACGGRGRNAEDLRRARYRRSCPQCDAPVPSRLHACGSHPLAGETRGVGLVGAVELVRDKATKEPFDPAHGVGAYVAAQAQENGLIVRALGDSVAFSPPLIITEAEIDDMFDRFETALEAGIAMAAGLD